MTLHSIYYGKVNFHTTIMQGAFLYLNTIIEPCSAFISMTLPHAYKCPNSAYLHGARLVLLFLIS